MSSLFDLPFDEQDGDALGRRELAQGPVYLVAQGDLFGQIRGRRRQRLEPLFVGRLQAIRPPQPRLR